MGSGGLQSFTPSVQGVAHVDCGQWLHSGLGPNPALLPGLHGQSWVTPCSGMLLAKVSFGDSHPWWGIPCSTGNMCILHCSLEFFQLWMSRETRASYGQAGLTRHLLSPLGLALPCGCVLLCGHHGG